MNATERRRITRVRIRRHRSPRIIGPVNLRAEDVADMRPGAVRYIPSPSFGPQPGYPRMIRGRGLPDATWHRLGCMCGRCW